MKHYGPPRLALRIHMAISIMVISFSNLKAEVNLNDIFTQYIQQVNAIKAKKLSASESKKEFAELNEQWRSKFQEIISRTPQSADGWNQIASELLAINQATGNINDALRLNTMLVNSAASPTERLSLLMNQAEFLSSAYSADLSNAELKEKTKSAFLEAYNSINLNYSLPSRLSFLTKYGMIMEKDKELGSAARIYQKGNALIELAKEEAIPNELAATVLKGEIPAYTREWFLESAIRVMIQDKDVVGAQELLKQLLALPEIADKRAFYFEKFASYQDPTHGIRYQELLNTWISTEKSDNTTAKLIFELAQTYHRDKNITVAAKLYSQLLNTPIAQPSKDDLSRGRGGESAEILYNLADCLEKLGDRPQASSLFRSFADIFPNDPRKDMAIERGRQ